jgi:Fe2+ transport system protein FeoA
VRNPERSTETEKPFFPETEHSSNRLRPVFWSLALGLGLLQVWAHRNEVSPDGISYMEMAEAAARGDWHALVNGLWSPLYPFLLSVVFRIIHPKIVWELVVAHSVNLLLYLANLYCFEFFLTELMAMLRRCEVRKDGPCPVPDKILWIWGYLLFLWAGQVWFGPGIVFPDLLVSGFVYLATALLLRIEGGKRSVRLLTGLGVVLGMAYLAKTAMFLVSFMFLLSSLILQILRGERYRKSLGRSLAAFAVFVVIAAPLVVGLSVDKQRFTFGDAGKFNYAQYIDHVPKYVHWQGEPAGTGTPAHPTRKIYSSPAMYEFAQPIAGSYPPWYDPSYWYEGVEAHFSLRAQLWQLFRGANAYLRLVSRTGVLYFVFLAVFLWVKRTGKWELSLRTMGWVSFPCLAALGMYALVHVEQRYVSGFALTMVILALSSARVSAGGGETLSRRVLAATILAPALAMAWSAARDLKDIVKAKPNEPLEVAEKLQEMGIAPGAQVGMIGSGLGEYWAHLAGVRIIAEAPGEDQPRFSDLDSAKKQEILEKFAQVGAKTVLTKDTTVPSLMEGWQRIARTKYYVWRAAQN